MDLFRELEDLLSMVVARHGEDSTASIGNRRQYHSAEIFLVSLRKGNCIPSWLFKGYEFIRHVRNTLAYTESKAMELLTGENALRVLETAIHFLLYYFDVGDALSALLIEIVSAESIDLGQLHCKFAQKVSFCGNSQYHNGYILSARSETKLGVEKVTCSALLKAKFHSGQSVTMQWVLKTDVSFETLIGLAVSLQF
jgi:hypothetical protein